MQINDKEGNIIHLKDSGVYLILAKENRARMLFKLTSEGFVRNVRDENILQKEFVGYNPKALRLVMDELHQEFVFFGVKGKHYKIPILKLLDNKRYLYFKKKGFELQQFVSLGELEEWCELDN